MVLEVVLLESLVVASHCVGIMLCLLYIRILHPTPSYSFPAPLLNVFGLIVSAKTYQTSPMDRCYLTHCNHTHRCKNCLHSDIRRLMHQPILWYKWNIYQDNAVPNSI